MALSTDDFFTDDPGEDAPQIVRLAKEAMDVGEQIARTTEVLDGLRRRSNELLQVEIPAVMNEVGTDTWRDPATGWSMKLEDAVNSSLPRDVDKREEILDILRPEGVDEISKVEFSVVLAPGDPRLEAMRALLTEGTVGLDPAIVQKAAEARDMLGFGTLSGVERKSIAPQTFKKWLLDLVRAGKGNVLDAANIWHGRYAKVKVPKK